jgi:aminoglycoside phosphotransferase family enzyme
MNRKEIDAMMRNISGLSGDECPSLIETHISWVILAGNFAFKIKKPLHLNFLDFSTLEKREFYCSRELALNRRLTEGIYLSVEPVRTHAGQCFIGGVEGEIIDYAVKMKRMDPSRRMDVLLKDNGVSDLDMERLAKKMATFHQRSDIIGNKTIRDIPEKFADLAEQRSFLIKHLPTAACIEWAIHASIFFVEKHVRLLGARSAEGFIRDCHGDLHTRNIFLLDEPQPFDCIEFSDDLRQIDVLNEVAFLCMDLDAAGKQDISARFLVRYNELFPVIRNDEEHSLFYYYSSYRANVRAKVNSYRAKDAETEVEREMALCEADRYLRLMREYLERL